MSELDAKPAESQQPPSAPNPPGAFRPIWIMLIGAAVFLIYALFFKGT